VTAMALNSWDVTECDLSKYYSETLDAFDLRLISEYAALCTRLFESSPMTPFEARMRAWAHLIGRELDSHLQEAM
jgi:hypothetical protein